MLIENWLKRQVECIDVIKIQMPHMSKATESMKDYEEQNQNSKQTLKNFPHS